MRHGQLQQEKSEISQRIFDILEKKNWSMAEFASKLGVAQGTVSSWKNRGSAPSSELLQRICFVLEVSVDWLITGKENGVGSFNVSGTVTGNAIVGTNNGSFVVKNGVERMLESETADLLRVCDSLNKNQRFKLLSLAYALASENDDNSVVE